MTYADITFNDKNTIKRWLQYQRLESAITLGLYKEQLPSVIINFGAGNGELCKLLAEQYPKARIICYEPTPGLLNEAKENLNKISNIEPLQDIANLESKSVDLVYCL